VKHASELSLYDFAAHPIWTWAETEDESSVEPVSYSGSLPDDHDALFVSCEFSLRDGTRINGEVSVRMSDHVVYSLGFANPDGRLFGFPLQRELRGLENREQLAAKLGKHLDDVFPLQYSTPYVFSDGHPLRGMIN
jgi:hypothetical protein